MKHAVLWSALALVTASALAAESGPKATVLAAAKKLADQPNYSWRTTVESPGGGGRFRIGPTEGKAEKGGYICLAMTRGDNTFEAVLKGEKAALKTDEGWQSLDELGAGGGGGGQPNPARFMSRTLRNYRAPAAELEDLLGKVTDLKLVDGAYTGELTEEGVRSQMIFGRRPGGEGPAVSNPKGSVKVWLQDGLPINYQVHVQGTVSFNNNEMAVDRTTTTEVKEVGKTKVEVPAEAKQKVS